MPINWRPASNGFVIWSRQLRISRPSSPSSRRPSHIRRRSLRSNKRWLPHTRSNWRRPLSNCDSSSGRCSANAASGTLPRPTRRCSSCPKPSRDWIPNRRPLSQTPMRTRRCLGPSESHDDRGSSSRSSGNTGRPSIRCHRRNCLAVAVGPSGSSFTPTSRSGRRSKRQRYMWSKRCGTPTVVPTATTARRCRPQRGRRRPWRKAPSGRASWLRW